MRPLIMKTAQTVLLHFFIQAFLMAARLHYPGMSSDRAIRGAADQAGFFN